MAQDFERLRALLEQQETFPTQFTVKFIGKNTPQFKVGVSDFEGRFSALRLQSSRESGNGKHLALTYLLAANTADEIIVVLQAVSQIEDVQVML